MSALRKAVFLDRDGVLNRAIVRDGRPYAPRNWDEFEVLSGVDAACARLRDSGYLLVMVTNQPDVARGTQTIETVDGMNRALMDQLRLDACEVCAHDDADNCECRKPKPGLLTRAAKRLGIALKDSFVVGDRWRDIEAGRRAGCRTVFIDRGYCERRPDASDYASSNLARAAEWIVNKNRGESRMERPFHLRVKIFADGADAARMAELARDPRIQGFTTNPTLMRQAGVRDYERFAREVVAAIPDRPISFEVFSDDLGEMRLQALQIASWGRNIYVKIPVTNTRRESTEPIVRALSSDGVKLNVTAVMTYVQVERVASALAAGAPSFVSVFAGRIADTGRDPVGIMSDAVRILSAYPQIELIWASPRELLNVFQADATGCHIITMTPDLLKKLALVGKDLEDYSLDTVKMFYDDAHKAGYTLMPAATQDVLNLARAVETDAAYSLDSVTR